MIKYYWISGDGSGETYAVWYGIGMAVKSSIMVTKGIKTFKQAREEKQRLEDEKRNKNK